MFSPVEIHRNVRLSWCNCLGNRNAVELVHGRNSDKIMRRELLLRRKEIENLVKNDVLDEERKEKLRSMKGFRNIVVHRYGRIDDKLAFEILKENIGDFF